MKYLYYNTQGYARYRGQQDTPPNRQKHIYLGNHQYTVGRDFDTIIRVFDDKAKYEGIEPKADFFTVVGHLFNEGKDHFISSIAIERNYFSITISEQVYATEYFSLFATFQFKYHPEKGMVLEREVPSTRYTKRAPRRKVPFTYMNSLIRHMDRIICDIEAARVQKNDSVSA